MLRVVTIAVLLAWQASAHDQHGQPGTSFEGRWRLADRGLTTLPVVDDLIVTATESSRTLSVEQRLPEGARWVRYTIAGHVSVGGRPLPYNRAFPNIARWRRDGLLLEAGAAVRARSTPGAIYEEVWSIAGTDVLAVDITTRSFGGVPTTVRLNYRRLPRPALTPPANLVENAAAEVGVAPWSHSGEAAIEACDGDPCFTVRNRGSFSQTILLPREIPGRYLVIIGSGFSERFNVDGSGTGLPYLYALVTARDGVRITAHLQGMRARPSGPTEWVTMSGVFRMPDDSDVLTLQLHQASVKDIPQNGSAARFDNIGVFAFPTEQEARTFVESWRGR
jgi:hypothetical protein